MITHREWGTAVWDANAPECQTFTQFMQAMRRVFDQSVAGPAATRQLFRIRQGQCPVSNYAIKFRTLATSADWGERELPWAYINGLSYRLLDELNTCDLPHFPGRTGRAHHARGCPTSRPTRLPSPPGPRLVRERSCACSRAPPPAPLKHPTQSPCRWAGPSSPGPSDSAAGTTICACTAGKLDTSYPCVQ